MVRSIQRLVANAAVKAAQKLYRYSDSAKGGTVVNPRNWYEAGWPLLSGEAAYIPQIVQDARFDQNFITRREMLRRMRYWSYNSALVESILSVGERYTVGSSCPHVAYYDDSDLISDNEDEDPWYEKAELVTEEAFHDFGINGETMADMLCIGYRCQKVDGDFLFLKTRKRGPIILGNETIEVSKPALQMVEGHRIETPWNKWTEEGIGTMDGVEFETVDLGWGLVYRRKGFWVRAGFGAFETNSSWTLVPEGQFFYLRSQQRANQPRAVSDFYSVEVDINKLEDLLLMEMKAQATQSERAVGVENAAGQFNPLDPKLRAIQAVRGVPNITDEEQQKATLRMQEFYRKAYGGQTYAFKSGEKIHFNSPVRPSQATLNLFELLVNKITAGMKTPRFLCLNAISGESAKAQGTEVRGVLDSADGYFEREFQKWKHFLKGAAIYHMEWAIKNDPRVADPPANWKNCIHIQQPKACNVDVGYNAQAATMELASGQTNYDLLYGPRGLSARRELRKLARQQRFIERLKLKLTLPSLLPGQIPLDGSVKKETPVEA